MTPLALGIVTDTIPQQQLRRLARSIECAMQAASRSVATAVIYTVDRSGMIEWPQTSVQIRQYEPVGDAGVAAAMNMLLEQAFADAPVCICVDADGLCHHAMMQEMLSAYAQYPEGLIEARRFPEELPKVYDPLTWDTPWAAARSLLIPRTVYESIGGFDPFLDDPLHAVDLSWRVRAADMTVKVAPRALFAYPARHGAGRTDQAHRSLGSVRYLAHKWGNTAMVRWAEEEMVRQGAVASQDQLPALPAVEFRMDDRRAAIAGELRNYPQLASVRWRDLAEAVHQ